MRTRSGTFAAMALSILTSVLSGCPDGGSWCPDGGVCDAAVNVDTGYDASGLPHDRSFASPEGVLIWNDRVFVTNANFAYHGSELRFSTGFLTVIDAVDGTVLNRIATPFPNPQEIVVSGDRLWVLCSGSTRFDKASSLVITDVPGGLAAYDLDGIESVSGPSEVLPIPSERGSISGYPSGILVRGDVAWIASGTSASLFQADLGAVSLDRGADDPVMVGEAGQNTVVMASGPGESMLLALFNDDEVMLADADGRILTQPWERTAIGMPGQVDGILDIAFDADRGSVLVLLGLAGRIVSFDALQGPSAGVAEVAGGLMMPNRMKIGGDSLLVANSGDNSLLRIDLSGTSDDVRTALGVNCNPWDLDVVQREGGLETWVSCVRSGEVVRVGPDGSVKVIR